MIVNFVLHVLPGLAGALAGWIVILALGAGLAWRGRPSLPIPPRSLAGFSLAGTAIFWIALASRQLLIIPDHILHTMIPATIRAGGWPPTLGWSPDLDLAYHHGIDLLVGLLAPPIGPDMGLATEVVGAYVWTGFALVVATLFRRDGRVSLLVLSPLLLTAGAWTLIGYIPANILQIPLPIGFPEAGIRASLEGIYWPAIKETELPFTSPVQISPPNVWKPPFVLTYALVVIVPGMGRRRPR